MRLIMVIVLYFMLSLKDFIFLYQKILYIRLLLFYQKYSKYCKIVKYYCNLKELFSM